MWLPKFSALEPFVVEVNLVLQIFQPLSNLISLGALSLLKICSEPPMRASKWALAFMALSSLAAPAYGRSSSSTAFQCSAGLSFQVQIHDGGRVAAVRTSTREFVLSKKATSIGVRFSSREATLIIDGNFAAFVADEEREYSHCEAAARGLRPKGS